MHANRVYLKLLQLWPLLLLGARGVEFGLGARPRQDLQAASTATLKATSSSNQPCTFQQHVS